MSQGARIFLGVAMLLLAAGFLALVPFMRPVSPQAGPGMAGCGIFCGLVAVACLSTASQPVTIRLIGGTVFVICLYYVSSQILEARPIGEELNRGAVRSQPGVFNSISFLVLVGLPSAYAAIRGRYPGWGRHASAFGASTPEPGASE